MTYYVTPILVEEENEYYATVPLWEGSEIADDSLDPVLPEIWEAVNRYLEIISEDTARTSR